MEGGVAFSPALHMEQGDEQHLLQGTLVSPAWLVSQSGGLLWQ